MNNLRKLAALLLALLMLLSVAQPVLAATQLPNGVEIWYGWQVTRQPTCTREGERARKSSQGNIQKEAIPKTKHKPGPWVVTKEATCTTRARSEHLCAVCGHMIEWQWTGELAPHTWGEWENVDVPVGIPVIRQRRVCQVCGKAEEQEIDLPVLPGGAEEYTISLEAELADPEHTGPYSLGEPVPIKVTVTNTSSITLYFSERNRPLDDSYPNKLAPGESGTVPYTPDVTQHMLDKAADNEMKYPFEFEVYYSKYQYYNYDDSKRAHDKTTLPVLLEGEATPAIALTAKVVDPGPFKLGDKADILLTVRNKSDRTMTYSGCKEMTDPAWPETLGPHAEFTGKVQDTITQYDIDHNFHFQKHLSYWVRYKYDPNKVAADTVQLVIPVAEPTASGPSVDLTAELKAPGPYGAGEQALIKASLKNTCKWPLTYMNSSIEPYGGWYEPLNPDATFGCTLVFTPTQEIIDAAADTGYEYPLKVWVYYTNSYGQPAIDEVTVNIPLKHPEPEAKLSLSVIVPGGLDDPYSEDEKVTFHATAYNHGNTTLHDVKIYDFYGYPAGVGDIAPGNSAFHDFEYTVRSEDANAEGVIELMFEASGRPEAAKADIWAEPVEQDLTLGNSEDDTDAYLRLGVEGDPPDGLVLGSIIPLKMTTYNEGNVPVGVAGIDIEGDLDYTDQYGGFAATYTDPLQPNEQKSFDYQVVVNSKDVELGSIHREFSVKYHWTNGNGAELYSNTNNVTLDLPLSGGEDHAELTLTCVSPLAPGAKIGDQVAGKFTLTNTGNVPLYIHDVELKE